MNIVKGKVVDVDEFDWLESPGETVVAEQVETVSWKHTTDRISPKVELGLRLFACGIGLGEAARRAGCLASSLWVAKESESGKAIVNEVRSDQEEAFKGLQARVNEVLRRGLDSGEPQIALAAANLWLRHMKEAKIKVELTAEDVIAKLIEEKETVQASSSS